MNVSRLVPIAAAALGAVLLVTAPGAAQQVPQAQPQLPDSVQQMLMEFQQVRQQLATIQEQTLEADAELRARQQAAEEAVRAAMLEADPSVEQTMERLEGMGAELREAQAQRDTARMRQIIEEGQRMQQQVQTVQAQAVQREDVAQQIQAYRDDLLEAMKAHDPRTDELLARMEDLVERLEAAAPR